MFFFFSFFPFHNFNTETCSADDMILIVTLLIIHPGVDFFVF